MTATTNSRPQLLALPPHVQVFTEERHEFDSTANARAVVIDWCYGFYNHQRRHSAAAGQSPINYETTALNRDAA
jgi:transposase InsO family protein